MTIVYYTANQLPESFAEKIRKQLLKAADGTPIISVSQKPIELGQNICIGDIGRSHINIYRQALVGARAAITKYIALAEDDVLYSPDHFKYHTPMPGKFAYNMNVWSFYTWQKPPIFSYKDRINLSGLICERELFVEAMIERFTKWPDDKNIAIRNWGEPAKYEKNLGVTIREKELFYSDIPNIAFSHPTALSYLNLGERKKLGKLKALEIPFWGQASKILEIYK